jgi:hypothetical protein
MASEVSIALVIGDDENDVGLWSFGGVSGPDQGCRQAGSEQSEEK